MPPVTVAAVLAAMLAGPVWSGDKSLTREERAAVYTPVAEVIVEASKGDPELAAALVADGEHESHWARYVLEGRCLDGPVGAQCDFDRRTKKSRARGPWQVWRWCKAAWRAPDGSRESHLAGAQCAVRVLLGAKQRCARFFPTTWDGEWTGAFTGLRTSVCYASYAPGRVRTMRKKLRLIQRAMAAG